MLRSIEKAGGTAAGPAHTCCGLKRSKMPNRTSAAVPDADRAYESGLRAGRSTRSSATPRHIEVIARPMMRWVKIEDVGDTARVYEGNWTVRGRWPVKIGSPRGYQGIDAEENEG